MGPIAWAILEDLALDSDLDEQGRLIATSSAQRLAGHLGIDEQGVRRALATLQERRLVSCEVLHGASADGEGLRRFVLRPSAGLALSGSYLEPPHSTPPAELARLVGALVAARVSSDVARSLAATHARHRIHRVLEAAHHIDQPEGAAWIGGVLTEGWDTSGHLDGLVRRHVRERAWHTEAAARVEGETERLQRRADAGRWAVAVSAALDDDQLRTAIVRLTSPIPGLGRRSVPAVQAALLAWASHAAAANPDIPLHETLAGALAARPTPEQLPEGIAGLSPPSPSRSAGDLSGRIAELLSHHPPVAEREPPGHTLSL